MRSLSFVLFSAGCALSFGCSDDGGGAAPTLQNALAHLCECAEASYCSQCEGSEADTGDCVICRDRQTCLTQMATEITNPTEACFSCVVNAACSDLLAESNPGCGVCEESAGEPR